MRSPRYPHFARHHHHHRPGGRWPFFRKGLQRRIFVWFGISIAVTTAVVMRLVWSPLGAPQFERAGQFLAHRFAEVWDDPTRRTALVTEIKRDFDVTVDLQTVAHEPLGAPPSCRRHALEVTVLREGHSLGYLGVCGDFRRHRFAWVPLLIAIAMLWAAAGAISRALARPLRELARVADAIGRGHLSTRVQLPPHTTSEFAVVGAVMNEMAARLAKQLADQRALLATVSHEIRTPLARMRLLIEMARAQSVPESALNTGHPAPSPTLAEALFELEREVVEVDTLVSDLLASSRLDFSALTPTRIDARQIATTALERAEVDVGRLLTDADDLTFQGDATLVSRAVLNLVENAKRHAGGVSSLRVEGTKTAVRFLVEDRGAGFQPGEELRIFEPFYRSTSSDDINAPLAESVSVGLGLALVRRIAEAHRGRAFAYNRPGGGAVVGIEFARA